mmetsp:Transcript_97688/g.244814  ORF Transcript_97688/g.244814 Transcript_97688/m.244814 type:complete len:232 (-) Transcript_97688:619-1314(-)
MAVGVAVLMPMGGICACKVATTIAVVAVIVPMGGVRAVRIRALGGLARTRGNPEPGTLALFSQQASSIKGVDCEELAYGNLVRFGSDTTRHDRCDCVHPSDHACRLGQLFRRNCIDLVEKDLISKCHLLCWLIHSILWSITRKLCEEVDRVHYSEDAIDLAISVDDWVHAESFADRTWVGDACSFDQNPINHGIGHPTVDPLLDCGHNIPNRRHEVVPHSTTQAAVVKHGD